MTSRRFPPPWSARRNKPLGTVPFRLCTVADCISGYVDLAVIERASISVSDRPSRKGGRDGKGGKRKDGKGV